MEQSAAGRRWNRVLLFGAGIAVLAVIAFALYSLSGGGGLAKPRPPKITLLPNTPPPPPPPKEEKKPDPPKEQKEMKMEQTEQKQAPPNETLKMEGPVGNGPSGIQAGTVTNENLSKIGGGGNAFAFYSNFMQKFLQDELARNKTLAGREYRIAVMLWLDGSGRIEKFNLTQSSGNPQTDTLVRNALAEMPPFKAPPENFPRPVGVRISSRG